MLPELWKKFNLDSRKHLPDLCDFNNRITSWYHLLIRWTTGTVAGVPASQSIKLLNYRPGEAGYIELDALKVFLENWKIPLPLKLYEDYQILKNKSTRELSVKQVLIESVRKIAKTIWEKEPITIPAMYDHPEIIKAYGRNRPAMKTFRRHMKGLNPDPKPGRRKSQKGT